MDLALGRCRLLTGSVSRCWDSSCGRKDAHLVFPGLELFFWLFLVPLCSVNVQLMGGGYNAWWHIGVGSWKHSETGRPGMGVHCWMQGRERGNGGTESRWLLGLRELHAAGKLLDCQGRICPTLEWAEIKGRCIFLVWDPDPGSSSSAAL